MALYRWDIYAVSYKMCTVFFWLVYYYRWSLSGLQTISRLNLRRFWESDAGTRCRWYEVCNNQYQWGYWQYWHLAAMWKLLDNTL